MLPYFNEPADSAAPEPDALAELRSRPVDGERLILGLALVDYMGHLDHHLRQLPGYLDAG